MKLGATGKFPEGKSHKDDEGGLTFAVGLDGNNIAIQFGTPVTWFSMPPRIARQLAETLANYASKLDPPS